MVPILLLTHLTMSISLFNFANFQRIYSQFCQVSADFFTFCQFSAGSWISQPGDGADSPHPNHMVSLPPWTGISLN